MSPILTFRHKRTPPQKHPKMMKIQGGQKFSHTLQQTNVGTKSHLHAEMKTHWTVSLEKKTGGKQEGAEIGAGES